MTRPQFVKRPLTHRSVTSCRPSLSPAKSTVVLYVSSCSCSVRCFVLGTAGLTADCLIKIFPPTGCYAEGNAGRGSLRASLHRLLSTFIGVVTVWDMRYGVIAMLSHSGTPGACRHFTVYTLRAPPVVDGRTIYNDLSSGLPKVPLDGPRGRLPEEELGSLAQRRGPWLGNGWGRVGVDHPILPGYPTPSPLLCNERK